MNDWFDEQTDFSFLNITEQKSSVASKAKQRKDRSVRIGNNLIDVRMSFPGRILSTEHKAKISAGLKRYYISKKNVKI